MQQWWYPQPSTNDIDNSLPETERQITATMKEIYHLPLETEKQINASRKGIYIHTNVCILDLDMSLGKSMLIYVII